MNSGLTLLLAFGIGVVTGLRSFTAPAVVAWAAHLGWINLHGSVLAFMGSKWSVGIFTILALLELVADQLPSTPPRTGAVGLSARIVTGALTGAALAVAGGAALGMGAVVGAIGAVVGAFGGYHARVGLVRGLRVPDFAIALPEDAIAIGLGLFLTSRF
ncbi:MAG: DUF4126 family protein [Candidatus Sulfotelmatobacter sp.]